MEKKTLELSGFIYKEEILETLENNVIHGTFVMENIDMFPGYHGLNLPKIAKPNYIFVITKQNYENEKIRRVTRNVKKYFKHYFRAEPAILRIYNNIYYSIRLKDLGSYELIKNLQECYMEEGISFSNKKKFKVNSLLKIQKSFSLEILEKGIYKGLGRKGIYYFEIPNFINWKLFSKIAKNLKNNISNNNFDLASGGFFRVECLKEVVRVYSEKMELEELLTIRERFLIELKKIIDN